MEPRDMASSESGCFLPRDSAIHSPGFQPCRGYHTSQSAELPKLPLLLPCPTLKQRAADGDPPLPEAPPPVPEALPGGRVPRELRPAALPSPSLERLIVQRLSVCRPPQVPERLPESSASR